MQLESINDRVIIVSDGRYVVMYGTKLWIFCTDGRFIAYRPDLCHVSAVLFLPDDQIFVDGGNDSYHIVSLTDGSEIWSHRRPKPMEYPAGKLVASKDYRYIYTFYEWRQRSNLVSIDLERRVVLVQEEPNCRYTTKDIACDENDRPCLLKTVYSDVDNVQCSDNGIELFEYNCVASKPQLNWKHQWRYWNKDLAFCFLGSTDVVLTKHLIVHNLKTDKSYFLLENEEKWTSPSYTLSDCWMDVSGRYLTLKFMEENVVVNVEKRMVAGVYPGKYFCGCLIENEYWMSVGQGVERKPFLNVDAEE